MSPPLHRGQRQGLIVFDLQIRFWQSKWDSWRWVALHQAGIGLARGVHLLLTVAGAAPDLKKTFCE